jgi:hypothetical protein
MFNVNPNAFIFPGQAKPEDFETSLRVEGFVSTKPYNLYQI